MQLSHIRKEFLLSQLGDQALKADPIAMLQAWIALGEESMGLDMTAFTLSTVSKDGKPDARILLLKGVKEGSLIFYSNYNSKKGKDLASNPNACASFFWPQMECQVRIHGQVNQLDDETNDAYFLSRPQASRAGAIASDQSLPIASREALETKFNQWDGRDAEALSRPDHWGGYAMTIDYMEFWQGRASRLHDRIAFTKTAKHWASKRLQP